MTDAGTANIDIERALRVLDAAMAQASDERLWLLHSGLEKLTMQIVRGGWGGAVGQACPLTVLYGGSPKRGADVKYAARDATAHLASLGLKVSDFYKLWDQNRLSARRVLRRVDAELTRRALAPRSRNRPST